MYRLITKSRIGALLFTVFVACSLFAQEDNALMPTNRSTVVGVGRSTLVDTYLSPLDYTGTGLSILSETFRKAGFINDKLVLQQQFAIDVAFTKNPAHTSSEYYGNISYKIKTLYPIIKIDNFKLLAGGGVQAGLGGIYNVRNSNNPGSIKTSVNLDLSAMALYNWNRFTFRWQLSTPFVGMFFSPAYGQSYYEIFSLGNDGGTVQLASFNNYLALQNYITVDIPIKNVTLRTGYLGGYYKTDVNNIYTNIVSHQFVLGFAVESLNFGGKKIKKTKLFDSVYY